MHGAKNLFIRRTIIRSVIVGVNVIVQRSVRLVTEVQRDEAA